MTVVRGLDRLATLTRLTADEARAARPAREVMLDHLLKRLLIEALRSTTSPDATPGLLHGLADRRLAPALRAMHAAPGRAWTVAEVAAEANLSRSAFFTRFQRIVGLPPMDYLLNWRMTLAKHMLHEGALSVGEIAARTGYRSTSAFSVAFSREVGTSSASFVRSSARTSDGP
jgi:AraC-like DNA-binding protein